MISIFSLICLRKSIESARWTVKFQGFVETYLALFSVSPSILTKIQTATTVYIYKAFL